MSNPLIPGTRIFQLQFFLSMNYPFVDTKH